MAMESSKAASGGASADSYVGSLISLTSKSEIRYEGVLYNINTDESSIGLRNVRSFGTEGRKKDGPQVPPSDKIYEYILFRGSDIKDLQVKASAPVQTTPPITNDPAIIQSHYPRPANPAISSPAAPSGTFGNQVSAHSAQTGFPGSTIQSGLPLYQPGTNLNSWGPSPPPNAAGGGLGLPMYWQGYYAPPNVMPQSTLLPPPHGLPVPPPMQQMQFSDFSSSSVATASQGLPASSSKDYHQSSPFVDGRSNSGVTSTLPSSTLSLNMPSLLHPGSFSSGTMVNQRQSLAPVSSLSTVTPASIFPSLAPLSTSVPANAGTLLPSVTSKASLLPSSAALPQQPTSLPISSLIGASITETLMPSLVTPGQLLQYGIATVSASSQPLQTAHKDAEVVQVQLSPKQSSEPSAPVATEAQPPLLPTPPNARAHKPNGGGYHMRNNYRGRGGRGYLVSRPVAKFTEDFDFSAMNEKFNKDEIWGDLGKKSQSEDKEGNGTETYEDDSQGEDDTEQQNVETKASYNKDDFFDSLSCNALNNDPNHGRTRYSEQRKLDTETFGEFSRHRGGRGGRGYNRGGGGGGGGRFRGSYRGRGYDGGYGYGNRGRGGPNRS